MLTFWNNTLLYNCKKKEVNKMMRDLVEEMFCELMEAENFEDWFESEGRWEDWEARMVEAGLDADVVEEFFSDMAWDL